MFTSFQNSNIIFFELAHVYTFDLTLNRPKLINSNIKKSIKKISQYNLIYIIYKLK